MISNPLEFWVQLHYCYKSKVYKYNLPLPHGEKFLDGLKLEFERDDIPSGQCLSVTLETSETVVIDSLVVTGHLDYGHGFKDAFIHDYQFWSRSQEQVTQVGFTEFEDFRRFFPLRCKKRGFFDYSYACFRHEDGVFLTASLDESMGYTIFGADVRHNLLTITKDLDAYRMNGRQRVLDIALLKGDESTVFDAYAILRKRRPVQVPSAFGWVSNPTGKRPLNERDIRKNLAACRSLRIPLDYFIVGKGWQSSLGEWEISAPGFPSGMASVAAEIRGSSYTPGLWFAPFVVSTESAIFRTRKDWLARESGKRLRPVHRSQGRDGVFYALDISRPDVREYIAGCYDTMHRRWGFKFFILDLLYVAGLYPLKGMSRGAVLSQAMDFLYSLEGGATWLLSQVPLEHSFGKAHYYLITANVMTQRKKLPFWDRKLRETISHNSILFAMVKRSQLSGRFFAPAMDSFILAGASSRMDFRRRYTQVLLQMLLGRFVMNSDFPGDYSNAEKNFFLSLFPVVEKTIHSITEIQMLVRVAFSACGREYISISNLAEHSMSFQLPHGSWFGIPGLHHRAHHIIGGRRQYLHCGESRVYLQLNSTEAFAGSSGHIFAGCEIESLHSRDQNWEIVPKKGTQEPFRVWLRVANAGSDIFINRKKTERMQTVFGETFVYGTVQPMEGQP